MVQAEEAQTKEASAISGAADQSFAASTQQANQFDQILTSE